MTIGDSLGVADIVAPEGVTILDDPRRSWSPSRRPRVEEPEEVEGGSSEGEGKGRGRGEAAPEAEGEAEGESAGEEPGES